MDEARERRKTWWLVAVISLAVFGPLLLLTAIIVVGLALGDRPTTDKELAGAPTYPVQPELSGRVVWSAPAGGAGQRLAWLSGDTFAYAEKTSGLLTGRATEDGKVRWQYRIPAVTELGPNAERICTVTPQAFEGLVAISYQRTPPSAKQQVECSGLMLFDLRTGKPRWNAVRPNRVQPNLTFAGGRLVLVDYGVSGYDLTSSRPRWSHSFEAGQDCQIMNAAGSQLRVAVTALCGPVRRLQAWTLDPATGAVRTRTNVGPAPAKLTMALSEVISAEPVVIVHSPIDLQNMRSEDELSTLSEDGRRVQSSFRLPTGVRTGHDARKDVLVTGQQLLVPTDDGKLRAYDLRTGLPSWVRVDLAPDGHAIRRTRGRVVLAGADGRSAYGMVIDIADKRPGVFRADLGTGEVTMISAPVEGAPVHRYNTSALFWNNGRLYGVNDGDEEPAAFAIS